MDKENAKNQSKKNNSSDQKQAYVLSRGKAYNKLEGDISKIINSQHQEESREYYETIRNLAIVSGAIATFSLMLLELLKSIFLVVGICLLLIVVMMSFVHIFGITDKQCRDRIKFKNDFLRPAQEMSKNCIDFLRRKKTFDEWIIYEGDFIKNKYDNLSQHLKFLSKEADRLNYTIDIITIIFIIAISLIIFAILQWAIVPNFENFIFHKINI